MLCHSMGINSLELIKAASTKPFGFLAHWPSRGIGGHCIPKDTDFSRKQAERQGIALLENLLRAAIELNTRMPFYAVDMLAEGLNEVRRPVNGSSIAVLGVAYKPDIDDTRETPVGPMVCEVLRRKGNVRIFDPFVDPTRASKDLKVHRNLFVRSLDEALEGADGAILATAHSEWTRTKVVRTLNKYDVKVLVDGQNALKLDPKKTSFVYKGIGR